MFEQRSYTQHNYGDWTGIKSRNQYNIYGTDGMVSAIFTGDDAHLKMTNAGIVIGKTHDIGTVAKIKKNLKEGINSKDYRSKEFKGTLKNVTLAASSIVAAPLVLEGSASILAEQGINISLIKTGISATAQYTINHGNVNVVGALADGFLTTGAGSFIGASFEFNLNKKGFVNTKNVFSGEKVSRILL